MLCCWHTYKYDIIWHDVRAVSNKSSGFSNVGSPLKALAAEIDRISFPSIFIVWLLAYTFLFDSFSLSVAIQFSAALKRCLYIVVVLNKRMNSQIVFATYVFWLVSLDKECVIVTLINFSFIQI